MATNNGNNTASIGFEQQIWAAADILRGNMDAAEYKHVVLGLIFLKYISDKFEARYQELLADDDDVEDKDAYAEVNVFFVPHSARWSVISEAAHREEIGTVIDDAMRAIEKENKRLKDILPKNYGRDELDKRRLGNVVDLFTNIQMIEHGTDKDILGRTYEYCLSKFAEQEGKRAGEFYTPSCVVHTLVEVLQPFSGRVYDPCCGSGGMYVQSAQFVENHAGNISSLSIYGQDSNPTTRKMALMNLAIRGIEADLGAYNADTFHNDLHKTLKADFILANPPFNLSDWNDGSLNDDQRWKYGLPPAGNANFAWLQHMISHLAPNGKIGMVLANGSLSSQSGGEGEIRRRIIEGELLDGTHIEGGLVEGIIAMPTQLFYTTQIPVSLWFISRNKTQKGKTLFIDARKMGTMVNRRLREMTADDIAKISATFEAFDDGTLEDVKGFCAAVATEEIAKQDYILTPGRYVGIEEQEDDGEPFDEKMTRLTGELSGMFKRSHELEDEIRKRLGAIGYEI
jgi:type I restriction enzyme M protein